MITVTNGGKSKELRCKSSHSTRFHQVEKGCNIPLFLIISSSSSGSRSHVFSSRSRRWTSLILYNSRLWFDLFRWFDFNLLGLISRVIECSKKVFRLWKQYTMLQFGGQRMKKRRVEFKVQTNIFKLHKILFSCCMSTCCAQVNPRPFWQQTSSPLLTMMCPNRRYMDWV